MRVLSAFRDAHDRLTEDRTVPGTALSPCQARARGGPRSARNACSRRARSPHHHHRGDHPRGHRRTSQPRPFEQIGEVLITEQRRTMISQQPIHTPPRVADRPPTASRHLTGPADFHVPKPHNDFRGKPHQPRSATPKTTPLNLRRPSSAGVPIAAFRSWRRSCTGRIWRSDGA
jgi:hypothetical protein